MRGLRRGEGCDATIQLGCPRSTKEITASKHAPMVGTLIAFPAQSDHKDLLDTPLKSIRPMGKPCMIRSSGPDMKPFDKPWNICWWTKSCHANLPLKRIYHAHPTHWVCVLSCHAAYVKLCNIDIALTSHEHDQNISHHHRFTIITLLELSEYCNIAISFFILAGGELHRTSPETFYN